MTNIDRVQNARDQIAKLDARLGVGVGAKRERAYLQGVIDGIETKVKDRRKQKLARKHKVTSQKTGGK